MRPIVDLILLLSVSVIVLDVHIILDLGPLGVLFNVMLAWVVRRGDWYAINNDIARRSSSSSRLVTASMASSSSEEEKMVKP